MFLYITFYTTSIAFLFSFFFFKFQAQYSLSTNFTILARFHERHTSSKYTNFQTRNLHFEMTLSTNFHIAFYLLTTNHPRVINHPLHSKQKKKNPSLQIFMARFTIVINHRTIALNTDTSPIYVYISDTQWQD